MFVNEPTSEGRDLPTLTLPDKQDELVSAVAAANPHTIVVLETGGPAAMPWIDNVSAAIEIWYPGIRGAEALANILFGDVNPSAKLPATFAKVDADLPHPEIFGIGPGSGAPPARAPPAAPGSGATADGHGALRHRLHRRPEGRLQVVRRREQGAAVPLRPRALVHDVRLLRAEGRRSTRVSFTVRNTGKRAGAEIAQVYAGLPAAAKEPPKRLVAWEKIQLAPGESKTVTLKLEPKFLSIFNEQKDDWELLPGEYRIFVGGSSAPRRSQPP